MIERKEYLNTLLSLKDKDIIKVVTGIRRSGKSTLLLMFRDELRRQGVSDEQIIFINLEDGDFREIQTSEALFTTIKTHLKKGKKNYVCIDEVQNVTDFPKAVDWLYADKNIDLYLTGSNAFLLSSDIATLLSGRYVEIKMMPLSFKEYTSAFPSNENSAKLFMRYLTEGSFPGILQFEREQDRKAYLEGLTNTILVKDIITRTNISNPSMLRSVIEYMFQNIGNCCSASNISHAMASMGRKISEPTVSSYVEALCDSFVLYQAKRYDVKGKKMLESLSKYYVADIGLRYYLLGSSHTDIGHILENIVYLELVRRGFDVHIGKVYQTEVDFIVTTPDGTEYYQVAQTVMNQDTLQRELAPLEAIRDNNQKYLLTMDYVPPTSYNGIKQRNLVEWLLE